MLWARKSKSVPHLFNYDLMKAMNGGTQMKDVWLLPAIAKWEKAHGKRRRALLDLPSFDDS